MNASTVEGRRWIVRHVSQAVGNAALILVASAVLFVTACDRVPSPPEGVSDDLHKRIEELYGRAREAGGDVPTDVMEWARSDIGRIGDWEYQVLELNDDALVEARLNELGSERWDVIWIRDGGEGLQIFLKRPARSYLQMVPLGELSRLAPGGSGE